MQTTLFLQILFAYLATAAQLQARDDSPGGQVETVQSTVVVYPTGTLEGPVGPTSVLPGVPEASNDTDNGDTYGPPTEPSGYPEPEEPTGPEVSSPVPTTQGPTGVKPPPVYPGPPTGPAVYPPVVPVPVGPDGPLGPPPPPGVVPTVSGPPVVAVPVPTGTAPGPGGPGGSPVPPPAHISGANALYGSGTAAAFITCALFWLM